MTVRGRHPKRHNREDHVWHSNDVCLMRRDNLPAQSAASVANAT
jgi:hypothetical protein